MEADKITIAPNNIVVKIENLTRKFGSFMAVDNISLTVRKGEIFGFLGPNGAGKTTTIRMLCGLLLPTSGDGTVGGFDIMTQSENIKKNIGYMSQKFSLYDDLTVEENINFFSGIYGVSGERKKSQRDWVLEMAGLTDRHNSITKTLPSGFKQRLALGCAILHEPPIIFLDEPTSGVDPVSRRNFWNLIYKLSRQDTRLTPARQDIRSGGGRSFGQATIFVTTHYLDEAEYCDRLVMMHKARIIAEGRPEELKQKYMNPVRSVQGLDKQTSALSGPSASGASNGVKGDVLEIEAERPVEALDILSRQKIQAAIFGSLIHAMVADAAASTPQIKAVLEVAGIKVSRIERIVPSLEDVF